jgi:DNA-binding MarR family transcriptional regulator
MSDHENVAAQPADQTVETQETKLLQALLNKGPALPVELAVRTYSFPEEIAAPLEALEREGYVERQKLQKGEMFVLTKKGAVRVLGK